MRHGFAEQLTNASTLCRNHVVARLRAVRASTGQSQPATFELGTVSARSGGSVIIVKSRVPLVLLLNCT